MGHGTSSGRTERTAYSDHEISQMSAEERTRNIERLNARIQDGSLKGVQADNARSAIERMQTRGASEPVTEDAIRNAFSSLRSGSGYIGETNMRSLAEQIDRIRPGVRIEVANERSNGNAVYYEKSGDGNWYVSRVTRGRLSDRRPMQDAAAVVASILQGGVVNNPNRLRIINAR